MRQAADVTKTLCITLLAILGCLNGSSANAQICTREYMPVCGQVAGEPAPRTFGNRCTLAAAQAIFVSEGQCHALPISRPDDAVDAHGCKPSAGYLWNKELGSCVRPWTNSAITLEVAAYRRLFTGLIQTSCLLVRELTPGQDNPEWMPLYTGIQGFRPEIGVHYTVRVRKDCTETPPADAPDTTYTRLKVLRSAQPQ